MKITAVNPRSHKKYFLFFIMTFFVFFFLLFLSLGIWQIQRLHWKDKLIARVEKHLHNPLVSAPGKVFWDQVTEKCYDYLPVYAKGHFLSERETLVTALTSLGAGYWLLVPFVTEDEDIILVNRGFVPMDQKDPKKRIRGLIYGKTTIKGILRMSEKNGFYLRKNNPSQNIWYTRELKSIGQARGFEEIAPYYIDVDNTPNIGEVPIGGLTVVTFSNNHLVYAITWFVLATGAFVAGVFVVITEQSEPNQPGRESFLC